MKILIIDDDTNLIHSEEFDDYLELTTIANDLWADSVYNEAFQEEQEREKQMREEMYLQMDADIEANNSKHTHNLY